MVEKERPGTYVRGYYGVPAFIGGRIAFLWPGPQARKGKITGFDGRQLIVKFDDEAKSSRTRLHPTWKVEYL